jgi:hypothetical protein
MERVIVESRNQGGGRIASLHGFDSLGERVSTKWTRRRCRALAEQSLNVGKRSAGRAERDERPVHEVGDFGCAGGHVVPRTRGDERGRFVA